MNELNQLMMAERSVFADMGGGKPAWVSVLSKRFRILDSLRPKSDGHFVCCRHRWRQSF